MRIKSFHLPDFKNLKQLDWEPSHSMVQVVIGRNATGKSNLLEALVAVFRYLDLGEDPYIDDQVFAFDFEILYEINHHDVVVERSGRGTPEDCLLIEVSDEHQKRRHQINWAEFQANKRQHLPWQVFAYYSGRNDRLEALFRQHQKNQYESLHGRMEEDENGIWSLNTASKDDQFTRRLVYCRHEHAQLILLALILDWKRDKEKQPPAHSPLHRLFEYLEIEDVQSALFVVKKPRPTPEAVGSVSVKENEDAGDDRFWGFAGPLAELLSVLWRHSLAPIGIVRDQETDFRGYQETEDTRYFFLNIDRLAKAADELGDGLRIFALLEALSMADMLSEIRLKVRRKNGAQVTLRELSEGEQQFLTVLGLIHLSSDNENLFLLDEPDTHLNPIWKYLYFDHLKTQVVSHDVAVLMSDEAAADPHTAAVVAAMNDAVVRTYQQHELYDEWVNKNLNQMVLTTHDPLMLGSLTKENVTVLRPSEDRPQTLAMRPDMDPMGMGYAGLLRSDLFGLQATVDPHTLSLLDRRNDLHFREKETGRLTADEIREKEKLNQRLTELGFSDDFRDPMYSLFVRKMKKLNNKPQEELFGPDHVERLNRDAENVMQALLKRKSTEGLSELAKELKLQLESENNNEDS